MQRKRFQLLIFFSSFLLVSPGCKPAAPVVVVPPHQGLLLRAACPGDPSAAVLRAHSRSWAAASGAKVEVVVYPANRGPDSVEQADIWVVRPADMPYWAATGRIQPLPMFYTERSNSFRWGSFLPLYRENVLLWDQKPLAFPLLGESPLFCYRADLLAKAGKTPPSRWDEVADLAEHFRDNGLEGKRGPSLPPLPTDDEALLRLFYTVAAPYVRQALPANAPQKASNNAELYSFVYDVTTGKPLIASPGFVHALSLLQRLQKCRPPQADAEPAEAFVKGRAVFCLTDASWLVRFQDRERSKVRDVFEIGRMPGSNVVFNPRTSKKQKPQGTNWIPYLGSGGWLAVVPRNAPHAEAAFELLADLCGPDRSERIALEPRWGGGPTRAGQLDRERWDAFDLTRAQTDKLKEALRQTLKHLDMKNPVVCLRTPDQAAHEAALAKELRKALEKNTDPAKALAAVARRWQELDAARDRERGPGTHLAEYRLSRGLLPGGEKE